jgi:alkylation response protein AidB-like acyl-CoA dehydrogenase
VLKDSVKGAQVRRTFGKPIAGHQAIQLRRGEMAARPKAARLLTCDAGRACDRAAR